MPFVNFTINNRSIRMACAEGDQGWIMRLARDLDGRIEDLKAGIGEKASAGAAGEITLAIMAAMALATEVEDLRERMQGLQAEIKGLQQDHGEAAERTRATQAAVAAALNAAAERIERATRGLNRGHGGGSGAAQG
jgi:cell division protein ZapA